MEKWTKTLAAAALIAAPVSANTKSVASPDSIADATIALLVAGKNTEAVAGFFGPGKLEIGDAQLAYIADQISSATKAYGPIRSCEVIDRKVLGTMVEQRYYLCQHTSFVTRWTLVFMRTGEGWRGAHLTFDDKLFAATDGPPGPPK